MHAVVEDPPAPPQRAGPLTRVLMGLLEKDPARRLDVHTVPGHAARAARRPAGQHGDRRALGHRPVRGGAGAARPCPPPAGPAGAASRTARSAAGRCSAPGESLTDRLAALRRGERPRRPARPAQPAQPARRLDETSADALAGPLHTPTGAMPAAGRPAAGRTYGGTRRHPAVAGRRTPPSGSATAARPMPPSRSGSPAHRRPPSASAAPTAAATSGRCRAPASRGPPRPPLRAAALWTRSGPPAVSSSPRSRAGRARCSSPRPAGWSSCCCSPSWRSPAATTTTRRAPRRRSPPPSAPAARHRRDAGAHGPRDHGQGAEGLEEGRRRLVRRLHRPGGQRPQGPHHHREVVQQLRAGWAETAENGLKTRSTSCVKPYNQVACTETELAGKPAAEFEYTCGEGDAMRHGVWRGVVAGRQGVLVLPDRPRTPSSPRASRSSTRWSGRSSSPGTAEPDGNRQRVIRRRAIKRHGGGHH